MKISSATPEIEIRELSFRYPHQGAHILSRINLAIRRGSFTGIIGPNGSGKTTLLKCIGGMLTPLSGEIHLGGQNLANLSIREIAGRVGVVPQNWEISFPFKAEELVLMGRFPHIQRFRGETGIDYRIVDEAMELTKIRHLKNRLVTELSGGELQRVIIAQALAQSPRILLLDEPTAALDIHHQLEILDVMKALLKSHGLTVIAVLHDLNLASHYCDELVLLHQGTVFTSGAPDRVLTEANLEQIYHTKARINIDPLTAKPFVRIYPASDLTPIAKTGLKVHLIGGGGSIAEILPGLRLHGFHLTCGVLNMMDSDWLAAKELQIPIVEVAPFCPITPEAERANLEFIAAADVVVLGNIPFGSGNQPNLTAALHGLEIGKQLLVCDFTPVAERDFTGGPAAEAYGKLKEAGGLTIHTVQELIGKLKTMA